MYSMSNTGKHPAVKMLHDANKALSKLKSKKSALKSPNMGNLGNMRFLVYIDVTYATWISLGGLLLCLFKKVVPIRVG